MPRKFWKWYDRGARLDFFGTLLGYVFDWKTWIATGLKIGSLPAAGGAAVTFLWAAIEGKSPVEVWVFAVVLAAAVLSIAFVLVALLASLLRMRNQVHAVPRKETPVEAPPASPQPDILLIPNKRTYSLEWDPPYQMQIISKPDPHPEEPDQHSLVPAFYIKNLGPGAAQEIELRWEIEIPDLPTIVENSNIMRSYGGQFLGDSIWLASNDGQNAQAWSTPCKRSAVTRLPFLGPELNNSPGSPIYMPYDVWASAEVYLASILPPTIGLHPVPTTPRLV